MRFKQNHKITTRTKITLFFFCAFLFLTNSYSVYAQKEYTIVLDAGHGGADPGNLGNGFKEKNIALKVALLVGEKLSQEKDINIIFTRKNDVFIELWKRGDIANHAKADLFVSIHCDSHTSKAFGAGTFVLGLRGNKKNLEIAKRENAAVLLEDDYQNRYKNFDPNSAESVIGLSLLQEENLDKSLTIASLIQKNFSAKLKRLDRKVKQDNFQVLRETIMPSVLVELGFLTNKKEGTYLNSKKGQEQMAGAVADAIKAYINNIKLNTIKADGVTTTIEEEKPTYKIQIAASSKKIAAKSYNFKGLKNIERKSVNNLYKYYYGSTSEYKTAKQYLKEAKSKGYKTAFLVAFKEGKKITIKEALKMN